MLGILESSVALDFDCAAAMWWAKMEERAMRERERREQDGNVF